MHNLPFPVIAILAAGLSVCAGVAVHAAPSTNTGQISVAQVLDLAERSGSDNGARNAILAYLMGVGEASGLLLAQGRDYGLAVTCGRSIELSQGQAVAALNAAAPDQASWAQTPATPIIIADMFARGDCK